jgi:hypothetical protein
MQLHRLLWMDRLVGSMRELAPYAALAFTLPGGTLIALALWAARHTRCPASGGGERGRS